MWLEVVQSSPQQDESLAISNSMATSQSCEPIVPLDGSMHSCLKVICRSSHLIRVGNVVYSLSGQLIKLQKASDGECLLGLDGH
jgi:hypothetical protein